MTYLNYNSTTSVDSRIVGIMVPIFNEWFGNPSSASHETGRRIGDRAHTVWHRQTTAILTLHGSVRMVFPGKQ